MTNNSNNNQFTNNSDGFALSGGTTARKLTLSGGDVAVVGSGSVVITFPSTTSTLLYSGGALGTPSSGTLTNVTGLPAASVVSGALANGMTATTQSANDNSTKLATTAYVDTLVNGGAWTSYLPAFTNLTVGNGTLTCAYTQVGKTITASIYFKFGSTSSVSGTIQFTFPVTSVGYPGSAEYFPLGQAHLLHSGVGIYYGVVNWANTTTAEISAYDFNTYVRRVATSSTVPFSWAVNDEIFCQFTYQAT